MGNRKAFLDAVVNGLTQMLGKDKELLDHNVNLITKLINGKSDKELEEFVNDLSNGKIILPVIIPNGRKKIRYQDLVKVIEKRGIERHKRIIVNDNGVRTMSAIPRLVLSLPIKKLAQMVDKKRSIASDLKSVNHLTGQVTSASKSMSVTSPELALKLANGEILSTKELTKYRGGDANARIVLEKLAERGLDITQETLEQYSSGPDINNTVKQLLLGMHIDTEIGELKR